MKKVILCAAALVFGTVAFAQVGGAPEADTPVTNMSADADANRGQSVQNGNSNKVRVRQAGTRQSVYTNQEDGLNGSGGNLGIIIQSGEVGPNSGRRNAAELRQSGSINESTTVQQGNRNNAITLQGQNDDGASTGNKARIQQGNNGQAERNYAAIEQDGTTNQATTLQRWDNNDAWTRQLGTDNKSMIDQTAPPEDSEGHEAANLQIGDRNESSIAQRGEGARNLAQTGQEGDDNQAKQDQTATHSGAGMGNRAVVAQGTTEYLFNVVNSVQALNDMTASVNSDVDLLIENDPFNGESYGAKAKQIQVGKQQEAEIVQFGGSVGASNYAEQNQVSGWGNDASIIQGHFDLGEPDNYARQDQGGDNNRAGLLQEGSGNKALQTQFGHRNDALTVQLGEGNLSNTHQRGNDNVGYASQEGNANRALIVQRHGQSYLSQQNGTGNQVDIYQGHPNDDFSNMIECDFDEQMNLDMDYTVPGLDIPNICPDC